MEKLEKYEEIGKIGRGTFGNVFKGKNKNTGEKVAIKKINKYKLNLQKNPDYFINSVKREIEILKKCQCENVVKLYDYFEDDDDYIIIMELCDKTLKDYLFNEKIKLSIEEIYEIFSDLNKAFKIMNEKNIAHRDVKLENILIKYTNEEKTKFITKLTDFGLSKEIEIISKNSRLGTRYTMAPEVFKGKPYDSRSDLWSLGVLLYICYCNKLPYEFDNLDYIIKNNKLKYERPDNIILADLIDKLLVININERMSWEEYFNHYFFTISSLKEIYIGFNSD